MTEKQIASEENKNFAHKGKTAENAADIQSMDHETSPLAAFQQQVGNRAVQRLLAQRSGEGNFDVDDDTANRINRERGSGQSLDSNIQAKMSDATGHDFSEVKVHTGSEAHSLNENLSAKAFTTGHDIFFREGAYDPGSSSGQELLAHELTHVVQQSSGRVGGGGGRMTVNAPGDAYEQEADSVAKTVTSTTPASSLQRQELDEEDEVPTKSLQRQEMEEDEDEGNG